jgi:hypothetical protein
MQQNRAGQWCRHEPGNFSRRGRRLYARIAEQAETIRQLWQRIDCADQRVMAEVEERRRLLALLTGPQRRP